MISSEQNSIFITGRYISYECQILEDGEGPRILEEGLDEDDYDFLDGGELGLADATIMDNETVVQIIDFSIINAPKVHLVTDKWCLVKIETGKMKYKSFTSKTDFDYENLQIVPYIDSFSGYKLNYINLMYENKDLEIDFSVPTKTITMLINDKGESWEFGED